MASRVEGEIALTVVVLVDVRCSRGMRNARFSSTETESFVEMLVVDDD